jgi:hypothetical protein
MARLSSVRNIILGGALALSVDRRMEDHEFQVCLNLEGLGFKLKGVAPTCVPCPICRRSKKGVPARTKRGPSSERMGEDKGKELGVRREQEEGKSKLIFELIIYCLLLKYVSEMSPDLSRDGQIR